jgi:hypothetical protein
MDYVKWVPCHHDMTRSQVAVGEEKLQMWRYFSQDRLWSEIELRTLSMKQ